MVVATGIATENEALASAFSAALFADEASSRDDVAIDGALRSFSALADDDRRTAFFELEARELGSWNPYLSTLASSAERRERALFLRYNSRLSS